MKVRAFVTDVDGTITERYPIIDLETASLLRNLESSGYPVILASGRAAWELYSLSMFLGLCRVVVGENGSVILNKEPLALTTLADNWYPVLALKYLKEHQEGIRIKKTLPRFTEVVLERYPEIGKVRQLLKNSGLPVKVLDSGYAYHVVCSHVEKSLGVKEALKIIGLEPSEAVAIGDSETDVSLFELCGYSVAVANSDDAAKDAADHITKEQGGQGFIEAVNFVLSNREKL